MPVGFVCIEVIGIKENELDAANQALHREIENHPEIEHTYPRLVHVEGLTFLKLNLMMGMGGRDNGMHEGYIIGHKLGLSLGEFLDPRVEANEKYYLPLPPSGETL
ncbi:hypothetical protein ACMXYX_17745 (plasmid) [Neptuniibacter sp. QD72_48]|uniref:hypothetical protein n=1 Tax=Neptuniibacter sp. QD72_48 TaxID=3398214 RepID=UPI0039F50AF9